MNDVQETTGCDESLAAPTAGTQEGLPAPSPREEAETTSIALEGSVREEDGETASCQTKGGPPSQKEEGNTLEEEPAHAAEAEEEATVRRLAGELEHLRAECPEVTAYSKLPLSVRREAQEQGLTLFDAYLRFQHRERQRVARAEADRVAAARGGMGSLTPTGGEHADPVLMAALRGVWG